jgi:hypothetical protein
VIRKSRRLLLPRHQSSPSAEAMGRGPWNAVEAPGPKRVTKAESKSFRPAAPVFAAGLAAAGLAVALDMAAEQGAADAADDRAG